MHVNVELTLSELATLIHACDQLHLPVAHGYAVRGHEGLNTHTALSGLVGKLHDAIGHGQDVSTGHVTEDEPDDFVSLHPREDANEPIATFDLRDYEGEQRLFEWAETTEGLLVPSVATVEIVTTLLCDAGYRVSRAGYEYAVYA